MTKLTFITDPITMPPEMSVQRNCFSLESFCHAENIITWSVPMTGESHEATLFNELVPCVVRRKIMSLRSVLKRPSLMLVVSIIRSTDFEVILSENCGLAWPEGDTGMGSNIFKHVSRSGTNVNADFWHGDQFYHNTAKVLSHLDVVR
jgi:hypothetical protein